VATGEAYIRVMSGGERNKGWELDPGQAYSLGRSRQCNIHLPDPTVSAAHARLECRGETWFIIDLNSTHGTRLNRLQIADPEPLFDRDLVWIGKTVLEFRQYEQLEPDDLAEIDRGVLSPDAPSDS
jgi:pSer/pThr/pTyr-binding forkhead associated (FHA) protein